MPWRRGSSRRRPRMPPGFKSRRWGLPGWVKKFAWDWARDPSEGIFQGTWSWRQSITRMRSGSSRQTVICCDKFGVEDDREMTVSRCCGSDEDDYGYITRHNFRHPGPLVHSSAHLMALTGRRGGKGGARFMVLSDCVVRTKWGQRVASAPARRILIVSVVAWDKLSHFPILTSSTLGEPETNCRCKIWR